MNERETVNDSWEGWNKPAVRAALERWARNVEKVARRVEGRSRVATQVRRGPRARGRAIRTQQTRPAASRVASTDDGGEPPRGGDDPPQHDSRLDQAPRGSPLVGDIGDTDRDDSPRAPAITAPDCGPHRLGSGHPLGERACYGYAEAAFRLSVGLTTIKKMVRSGQIRTIAIGGRPKIPASEIRRLTTLPIVLDRPIQVPRRGHRKSEKVRTLPTADEIKAAILRGHS